MKTLDRACNIPHKIVISHHLFDWESQRDGDSKRQAFRNGHHKHSNADDQERHKVAPVGAIPAIVVHSEGLARMDKAGEEGEARQRLQITPKITPFFPSTEASKWDTTKF